VTAPRDAKGVRCMGVELGADGVAEWQDRQRVVFVPREGIQCVELRRGIAGERPLLQVVFGGGACLVGVVLLSSLVGLIGGTGTGGVTGLGARFAAGGVLVLLLGGWVLWTGLRPAYYLRVSTATDTRKLLLVGKVDLAQLSGALRAAEERFGYPVKWNIDESRPPVS
jgi:hypothetical protein